MWAFGSQVDPKRPKCECLVALPGVIDPSRPTAYAIIDLADWPHWCEWSWLLIGIEPSQQAAVIAWQSRHPNE